MLWCSPTSTRASTGSSTRLRTGATTCHPAQGAGKVRACVGAAGAKQGIGCVCEAQPRRGGLLAQTQSLVAKRASCNTTCFPAGCINLANPLPLIPPANQQAHSTSATSSPHSRPACRAAGSNTCRGHSPRSNRGGARAVEQAAAQRLPWAASCTCATRSMARPRMGGSWTRTRTRMTTWTFSAAGGMMRAGEVAPACSPACAPRPCHSSSV